MNNSKQKQAHSSAPPTTRSTASIAGKLAAMATSSNAEEQSATETIEPVSMDRLVSELTKQRNSIREDICGLIQECIGPLQSSIDAFPETVDDFQGRLVSMETRVGENFENLIAAEKVIKNLQTQNSSLLDRIEDLENRSRRSNLRIVNIPEGSENNQDPVKFVSEMLKEVTGTEVFDEPPILERAHRSPGQKPTDGQKPRPFVVCFHRFQDKERLLRWSRSHEIQYKGNAVRIYPDGSQRCPVKKTRFVQRHKTITLPKRNTIPAALPSSFESDVWRTNFHIQFTWGGETVRPTG